MDKFKDECGIIAVSQASNKNAANLVFFGLNGLQHRGQESAGIAVSNDGMVSGYKEKGLVNEVIDEKILSLLNGQLALGHVKYSTASDRFTAADQPYILNYKGKSLAIAFNGGLVNTRELKESLEDSGMLFSTGSDSEVIAAMIARHDKGDIGAAIKEVMPKLKGGYSLGIMTGNQIIGVRDPLAMRPICLGKINDGYVISSESCAIDMLDGEFIRDFLPGEIIIIEDGRLTSIETIAKEKPKTAHCIFEYVYFARPDSTIDGRTVYSCRESAGLILAMESPAKADLVLGVPDSGTPAAIGYANGSGLAYSAGMIKNKYIGRTFIQPTKHQRELSVKIKLNPIRPIVKGKRVVLVDDSIVRGTTMKNLIASIKSAGATEVHLRISSPPVYHSCNFGVDTPDKEDLIANNHTQEELCKALGADSLGFISIEGLLASVSGRRDSFCTGCFSGDFPMEIPSKTAEK